jgi:hypothetical protein
MVVRGMGLEIYRFKGERVAENLSENALGYGGGRNELPYPSDLTAAQWALIKPLR